MNKRPSPKVEPSLSPDRGPFRIQVVAERSGVPAATLRAWERRYGVPEPERTSASYRLYSLEDIERVREMRVLCEQGMSAAEAAKAVLVSHPLLPLVEESRPHDRARARILQAASDLDTERLDIELMQLGYAGDALTLYERVVAPLLVDVGQLWSAGKISVAQEHFLSGRLEVMLRNALATVRPQSGPYVLFACISGEQHTLGLLGAALQFSGWGARPVLLGADTPPEAIGDAIQLRRPALIGLSSSRVPARPRSLFDSYAKAAEDVPWVVGGEASAELEPIIREAGGQVAAPASRRWQTDTMELLRRSGRGPAASRFRKLESIA